MLEFLSLLNEMKKKPPLNKTKQATADALSSAPQAPDGAVSLGPLAGALIDRSLLLHKDKVRKERFVLFRCRPTFDRRASSSLSLSNAFSLFLRFSLRVSSRCLACRLESSELIPSWGGDERILELDGGKRASKTRDSECSSDFVEAERANRANDRPTPFAQHLKTSTSTPLFKKNKNTTRTSAFARPSASPTPSASPPPTPLTPLPSSQTPSPPSGTPSPSSRAAAPRRRRSTCAWRRSRRSQRCAARCWRSTWTPPIPLWASPTRASPLSRRPGLLLGERGRRRRR